MGQSTSKAMKIGAKKVSPFLCLLILVGTCRSVVASDACEDMVPDWRFDLVLKSTQLLSGTGFVGTFELSNVKYNRTLTLPGKRTGSTLVMDYPDVSVQFFDLNSQWVSFTEIAGSFLAQPDRMEIKSGSRGTIRTRLMSSEVANTSGSDFRIMIRLFDPDICVISRPFHAVPMHSPVTGFETSH
jgi:hypothetical protein